MFSIKPYCRTDQVKKSGENNVAIFISKTGHKRVKVNTDLSINPKFFDNTSGRFTRGSGDMIKLNKKLDDIVQKLRDYVIDHPEATPQDVKDFFFNKNPENFLEYAREELRKDQPSFKWKTYKQYKYCLELMEKHWPGTISFASITADNLRILDYTLKVAGLGINTRKHVMKTIRKYVLRALQTGRLSENPFSNFKVGNFVNGEREWLDADEINKLKKLWENRDELPQRLHNTLVHFLHSCHTGLRAIDSRKLNTNEHVKGDFLVMMPSKSKDIQLQMLRVPLNDYAKYLHSIIDNYNLKVGHDRLNKDLLDICKLTEIDKHITFHCARHTFAINSLIVGVPLEVVSKWLGHKSVSTTQIYAKVVDSLSGSEMKKWNSNGLTTEIKFEIKPVDDGYVFECELLKFKSKPFESVDLAMESLREALGSLS